MRIELGNWHLEKATSKKETSSTIPIRMIANRLEVDKENQEILPQAFNKATVDNFIKYGIIDWHHQSVTGKTAQSRATAIIGKPTGFEWEDKLPIVYGNLTKAHPIVKESILPHLEADQAVFAASVGGNVRKARNVIDVAKQTSKEQILAINWDHIAIAASPYVISSGSDITMVKAMLDEGTISDDICLQFGDINSFETEYDVVLKKALTIGAGTDSANLTGVDALRIQSLESGNSKKFDFTALVDQICTGLKNNKIGGSANGVMEFLKAKGMPDETIKKFMVSMHKTVNTVLTNKIK